MVSGSGSGIKTCLWDRKMNGMSFPWWLLHEESFGLTAPLACAPCHCVLSALFDCFVLALHLYRGLHAASTVNDVSVCATIVIERDKRQWARLLPGLKPHCRGRQYCFLLSLLQQYRLSIHTTASNHTLLHSYQTRIRPKFFLPKLTRVFPGAPTTTRPCCRHAMRPTRPPKGSFLDAGAQVGGS